MITVEKLIEELKKVENKKMEVMVRMNTYITGISDTFEAEADGDPFVCIDCEGE